MSDSPLFSGLKSDEGEQLPYDGSAVLHTGIFDDVGIVDSLLASEPWEEHHLTMFGRVVAEPRRSVWHADAGVTYTYSGRPRIPQPWNERLQPIRARCETLASSQFNGVLVNLYRDGNDSMGWHADDEPVLGPTPVIASVSLGSTRRFEFKHRDTSETVKIDLPHGSVLVMSGASQQRWIHRVPKQPRVTSPRINLTFRHLLWVE